MNAIKQREGPATKYRLSRRTRRKWTDKQTPAATIPAARVRQNCLATTVRRRVASGRGLTRWRHLAATIRARRSAMLLGSEYGVGEGTRFNRPGGAGGRATPAGGRRARRRRGWRSSKDRSRRGTPEW